MNVLQAVTMLIAALTAVWVNAEPSTRRLPVADFSSPGLGAWQTKSFAGHTDYRQMQLDGRLVLQATTQGAASALYQEMDIDLVATPVLHWSWRVDKVFPIANQRVKAGDDYPARLYVVVKEGIFPWQTKALNYVWSNRVEADPFWSNPFTAKAVMIPVRSGANGLGQWQREQVNVRDDFYRVFNLRIERAHGLAIMSDGDNAGGAAVAYFGEIYFSGQ